MRSQSTPCELNPSFYRFILFLIHERRQSGCFLGEGNDLDLRSKEICVEKVYTYTRQLVR